MKSKTLYLLSTSLILIILQACSSIPAVLPGPRVDTPLAFVAEASGPAGFSASLTTPDIVTLTWQPVAEAIGYELQIVFDGLDPLAIAYLPQEATSFEHLMAPESTLLTYRLQTILSSGPGGASSLQITTLAHAPDPLTVQAAFSEDGVVSALIGPAGGTLETTDGRGITYTLVIPPGALNTELEITMTPVSAIEGWPLDGDFLGAVSLEPEGWLLDETATLTVRALAASPTGLSTTGFAFSGSGEEFHLSPAYQAAAPVALLSTGSARRASPALTEDAGTTSIPVSELRSAGIGETSADSAAAMAAENAPTSSSDAADQKAAATEVELDDLAPLLSVTELAAIATNNLLIQILNAQDCYEFKRAVGSFPSWEAKTAGLGDTSSFRETIMEQMAEKAIETMEKASEDCGEAVIGEVPDSVPCAEKLTRDIQSAKTPFYTELQQAVIKNADLKDRMTAADAASEKCAHSFGFNESTMGYRWISSCIPTLHRPYQVEWVGPTVRGVYRLYPSSSPLSGRVEGQATLEMPGITGDIVYDGTYIVKVTKEDSRGFPETMEISLDLSLEITSCVDGYCTTTTGEEAIGIPLLPRKVRCILP